MRRKEGERPREKKCDWRNMEVDWGGLWRGKKSGKRDGFGGRMGEKFGEVEVTLFPVVELHVPNEFGVGGHVVVSDYAAVPPAAELHSDEPSNEVMRVRERDRVMRLKVVVVGGYLSLSLPMGRRGL